MRSVEVKRVWNSAGLINNCKQAKRGKYGSIFLKKKKEVTETVEEPQKTVEAAKKRQRQLIQSRRQRSSVRLVAERSIRKPRKKINMSVMSAAIIFASVPKTGSA